MEAVLAYIDEHRHDKLYARTSALTAEQQIKLGKSEKESLAVLEEWLPVVKEHNCHFALKELLGNNLAEHLTLIGPKATPRKVRIMRGYQDRGWQILFVL